MGKVKKRDSSDESDWQKSPKKMKLDNENSNFKKEKKKIEKNKYKKKEETDSKNSDGELKDSVNSDSKSYDSEKPEQSKNKSHSVINDSASNSDSDYDKNSKVTNNSNNSDDESDSDKLVIDLDSTKKKKMQTITSLINLSLPSNEELQYRKKKDFEENTDYFKLFICTKCNFNFEKLIKEKQEISIHPLLNVLMCKKCCNYYGNGDFSLDSDNEDKYCRWCGEGGTIFSCSNCICGFCKKCIKKHFGKKTASEIELEDDWLCYFCYNKPLWELRYICSLAQQKCKELQKNQKATPLSKKMRKRIVSKIDEGSSTIESSDSEPETSKRKMKKKKPNENSSSIECSYSEAENSKRKNQKKRKKKEKKSNEKSSKKLNVLTDKKITEKESIYVSTSEDSDSSNKNKLKILTSTPNKIISTKDLNELTPFNNKKVKVMKELENILKLTEYQMSFGSNWSSKKLKMIPKLEQKKSESSLKKECQKIKWFISTLASYLVAFSNSIDLIEKSLSGKVDPVEEKIITNDSSYVSILKFLNFTSNFVKTLDKKNINLEYLLNSKLYEDDNVLGLEKKSNVSPKDEESDKDETASDLVEKNLELLFNSSLDNIVNCTK